MDINLVYLKFRCICQSFQLYIDQLLYFQNEINRLSKNMLMQDN